MTVWVGAADGSKKQLVDPYIGTPTGRLAAQKIWVGDATGVPRLVFQRALPVTLTAAVAAWDRIDLSWNNSGAGVTYALYRGSTLIYQGAALSYADTKRYPSTAYTYRLDAVASGVVVYSSTASGTTPARADMGLTATATSYANVAVSWSDPSGGMGHYNLYDGGSHIYAGPGKSFNHSVGASTGHNYTLYAYRDNPPGNWEQMPVTDTASASTPARPVSYGTAYSNVGWESWGGWTGSTQRNLGGPNIYVGVGGTFTNMHALVYSHGGVNFRGEPRINGVAGPQQVYNVGRSHTNWPFSLGFAAGTFTTSMVVGGSNWGQAEWSPWTGQRWDYYLQVNHLDYWYYASAERDAEIRAEPWFREELAERLLGQGDLYIETWSNEEGTATVKARVTDRGSGEVLIEWESGD